MEQFDIIGEISNIEIIAVNRSVHILSILRERYGRGRWRKLKGRATVQLRNGDVRRAEVHWFEAHGIGKKKMKIKRFLD